MRRFREAAVPYSDMNLFGVYIAPFVPMVIIAWIVTGSLLRLASSVGLSGWVWHPALFNFAVYVIVLYVVALGFGVVGSGRL
jgi:hypothetical protein